MIDIRFSSDHMWIRMDDDGTATVGISDYAQAELGDIEAVEPPEAGREIVVHEEIGMIEAGDATGEIKAPTSGTVIEINEIVLEKPELINESPLDDGWIFRMNVDDEAALEDLMDEDDYAEYLDSLA